MLPGLGYRQVGLGSKPRKDFVDRSAPCAPLSGLDAADRPGERRAACSRARRRRAVVAATASEIARLLAAAGAGEITLGGQPLRAGDIAVLVRSHAQGARCARHCLRSASAASSCRRPASTAAPMPRTSSACWRPCSSQRASGC